MPGRKLADEAKDDAASNPIVELAQPKARRNVTFADSGDASPASPRRDVPEASPKPPARTGSGRWALVKKRISTTKAFRQTLASPRPREERDGSDDDEPPDEASASVALSLRLLGAGGSGVAGVWRVEGDEFVYEPGNVRLALGKAPRFTFAAVARPAKQWGLRWRARVLALSRDDDEASRVAPVVLYVPRAMMYDPTAPLERCVLAAADAERIAHALLASLHCLRGPRGPTPRSARPRPPRRRARAWPRTGRR